MVWALLIVLAIFAVAFAVLLRVWIALSRKDAQ